MTEGVEVTQRGLVAVGGEVGSVDDPALERADRRDAGVDERDVGGAALGAVGVDRGAQRVERRAGGDRRDGRDGRGATKVIGVVSVHGLDPPSAAQRVHRAARDPGGESIDQRDLTHDMSPQVLDGLLRAIAGSWLLEHHDQRAALVSAGLRRREGEEGGEGPEDREDDPPANDVCRTVDHTYLFARNRTAIKRWELLEGRSGGCESFGGSAGRFGRNLPPRRRFRPRGCEVAAACR